VATLKRLREPAAFVVLGLLWVQLLIELIGVFVYGGKLDGSSGAMPLVGAQAPETLTFVILGLLVASCALTDRTRHARMIAMLALISSALAILVAVGLDILWLATASEFTVVDVLSLVAELVLPILVTTGLAILLGQQVPAGQEEASGDLPEAASTDSAPPAALPSVRQEPAWQPDEASGAAWHAASDAAVGAPAAGWGTPGKSGGWDPMPDSGSLPSADRSPADTDPPIVP